MIDVIVDVHMMFLLEYVLHHFQCLGKRLTTHHWARLDNTEGNTALLFQTREYGGRAEEGL